MTIVHGKVTDLTFPVFLNESMELFGIKVRNHVGTDMHELHLVEEVIHVHGVRNLNRNITGIDNIRSTLILIARCRRHHEHGLYTIVCQAFDDSVAGCSESAGDMWREFPSEHQHFHYLSSLYLLIILST